MTSATPLLLHEVVEVHFATVMEGALRDYWVPGFVTDVTGGSIAVIPMGVPAFPGGAERMVLPLPADGLIWRR